MSAFRKLLLAAVETIDNQPFKDHDLQPVTAPTLEEGDTIFSQEDGYVLAAEALHAQACSLENILTAIKDVPEAAATPELAATVQASLLYPVEPEIATENDVTDVEAKTSTWDKTKGHAATAAKTMVEATKRIIAAIVEFLTNVFDWIVTSRRGIQKDLEEQRQAIAKGPQVANIKPTRRMLILTNDGAFDAATVSNTMTRYAEVLAASTYAIEDIVNLAADIRKTSYKPDALRDFAQYFIKRTKGALDWKNGQAVVYAGEGGMRMSISIGGATEEDTKMSYDVDAEGGSNTEVSEAAFTRSDMVNINKFGISLMRGVSQCEPRIKQVQNSLRTMLAADAAMTALAGQQLQMPHAGKGFTQLFMEIRKYLTFANRFGVAVAVKAGAGASALGKAYLSGNAVDQTAAADVPQGEIVNKQLAYAG